MLKKDRQFRTLAEFAMPEETKRLDSDYYIEGYATTWEAYPLYEGTDGQPIYERFQREAFFDTDMSDIILQFDHTGPVFARKSNGTLIVEPDDRGLFIAADLSKTARGRELYEDIKTGMVTKMSWGFRPGAYDYDEEARTILHTSIKKIFDVSAVSIPANETTAIHARGFVDGVIDEAAEERRKRERQVISAKIKTILGD